MPKRSTHERDATAAELEAALAALADTKRELETLREAMRTGLLGVGADGTVTSVAAWPWPIAPSVGEAFTECFDPASAGALADVVTKQWLGLAERRFTLRDGRVVSLSAAPAEGGYRVLLLDVTVAAYLDHAHEQRKRMRAVSQLADALARELTDPMSIVQARLELLLDLRLADPEAVGRHLAIALDHSRRVTATLRNLRLVGRTAGPPTLPVPVSELVAEVQELLGPRASRLIVRIEPAGLAVACESAPVARVCASLARQSLETAGRGTIQLVARRVRTVVKVQIGPSARPTGDPVTDVDDLALDRTLLASVGGTLESLLVGITPTFLVTLPTASAKRARPRKLTERVLVVGPTVGEAIPMLLERDGYLFDAVGTATEAVAHLERDPCNFVIAELLLEGSSGLALAEVVHHRFPRTRVVVVADDPLPPVPLPVVPLRWPASRDELLSALGTRNRR